MVCRAPGFRIVKLQSGFEDDRIIPDIGPFALALGWIDDANRASRRIWFRACVGQRTAVLQNNRGGAAPLVLYKFAAQSTALSSTACT